MAILHYKSEGKLRVREPAGQDTAEVTNWPILGCMQRERAVSHPT